MDKKWLLSLVLLLSLSCISADKQDGLPRKKCGPYVLPSEDSPDIIYYEMLGSNNTVHYVYSLKDTPTLFMSVTEPQVNCTSEDYVNNTFNWTTFPEYDSVQQLPGSHGDQTFTIVFNRLIEFRDKHDGAQKAFDPNDLNNSNKYRNYSLNDLSWTFNNGVASGTDSFGLKWDIQINVPEEGGRLGYFPKTLYTKNSTTFDFAFQNFNYSSISKCDNIDCGRLVLDLILVHSNTSTSGDISQYFSRDDEYTPSIFLTYNYLFNFGASKTAQGYLQWKPIAYLSDKRKSTKSEQINAITSNDEVELPSSLAGALYTSQEANNSHVYLVMGTEGDDNNYNPKYVTWTGMLGFGIVPQDQISTVVIITIIVGLGVPLVLIVLGALYVVIKKKPWEKFTQKGKGYAPVINENDNDK